MNTVLEKLAELNFHDVTLGVELDKEDNIRLYTRKNLQKKSKR
jgi:hypothetical protein